MPALRPTVRAAILPALLLLAAAARGAPTDPPTPAESSATDTAAERTSRLQGTLSVDRRTKMVGATVLVRQQDDEAQLYLTSSGERGAFRIDGLADGDYELQLRREGFAPVTKRDVNVRFPFRAVVEVRMQPQVQASLAGSPGSTDPAPPAGRTLRLEGRVTDWDGNPQSGVQLRLVRTDGSEDPHFLATEADGSYAIPSVTGGTWRLEVQGVGFLPLRQPLLLSRDTRLRAILVPQPAGYVPSPLDLMPQERALPPPGWNAPAPSEQIETGDAPNETVAGGPQSPERRTAK